MTPPALGRAIHGVGARFLLVVSAALALAACEVRTEVSIDVDEDGSGTVELAVGLDEDALSRRPDVFDQLDLSDLEGTGWEVGGPEHEPDGFTWLRATHRYGSPEQVGPLVDQIAGEGGPLRGFRLVRDDDFAETRYEFEGVVDLTGGAGGAVVDAELAAPLGVDPVELLEDRIGRAVDELVTVQVAVRLPGDVVSNAPTPASDGAVWRPSVVAREAVELQATSSLPRTERWIWLAVAVAAGAALVLVLVVLVVRWRGAAASR